MKNKNLRNRVYFVVLIFIFVAVFSICVFIGYPLNQDILFDIRLPKLICVALIGASLTICGVCMQAILQNPLADGSTLGVSSSSSLGAVIALVMLSVLNLASFMLSAELVVVFSILFALISFFITLLITLKINKYNFSNTIILVGVVISFFCSGMISFIITIFPDNTKTIIFWTLGSVSGVNWGQVILIVITFLLGFIVIYKKKNELNVMTLGDINAKNLGINVRRTKIILIFIMSIIIGVCVSIAGPIAFVGLICPHICRKIIGPNHKLLILFSCIFGSAFLLLCDLLSTILIYPKEMPIGIITSFIGSIVFIVVFYSSSKVKNG